MATQNEDDPGLTLIQNERAWQTREHKRRTEIRNLFQPHLHRGDDFQALMDACLDNPAITRQQASDAVLNRLGQDQGPLTGDFRQDEFNGSLDSRTVQNIGGAASRQISITGGGHQAYEEEFDAACVDAIQLRGGIKLDNPHPAVRDVQRMRLSDMAEVKLRQTGISTQGMSRDRLVSTALKQRGIISHGTSDFSNLLENSVNKAIMIGFGEQANTHRMWVRTGSLPDFKQGSRVALSEFSDIEIVYENGEYKYGTYGDYKQTLTLQTYGKLFSISRQAIINDDTDAFVQVPRGLAAAAMRKEADAVYSVLTSNAAMPDGDALFHANHSNLVANGSGAAPSVTTIEAARVAMGTQTGLQSLSYLNIKPAFLIVPLALEGTGRVLRTAEYDPDATAMFTPNSVQDTFQVIADPRLDADDAAAWYMAADPSQHDTIELAFLDGNEVPYLETKDGWSSDGVEYKVRHDFVAVAVDYRGLYMNDGN